jgi:hypothetical protein
MLVPTIADSCGVAEDLPCFAAVCIPNALIYCTGAQTQSIRKPQVCGSIPLAGLQRYQCIPLPVSLLPALVVHVADSCGFGLNL